MSFEEVKRTAMALPEQDRARLADMLLASTEDESAEAAWEDVITERIRAIDEGREKGIPWEEVRAEMKRKFSL